LNLDTQRETTRIGRKKASWTVIPAAYRDLLKQQPRAKDAALMCFLLDHGLRCSEIAALTVEGINLRAGTFTFFRPKVKKRQTHSFTVDSLQAIRRYLPEVASGPLFPGQHQKPMSTQGINKRVGELGRFIGLENLSPHDCRHDWAWRIAKTKKTDTRAFISAGGWTSPAMALRYVAEAEIANEGVYLE
jgi:integrase